MSDLCAVCKEFGKIRDFIVSEMQEQNILCDLHYIEVLEMLLDESNGRNDAKSGGGGMLSRYSYNPARIVFITKETEGIKKIRRCR